MTLVKAAALDGLTRLDPAVRLWLVAGPDDGVVSTIAAQLLALAGDDAERVDIASAALKDDAGRLAGEAVSGSLFAARRVIRLTIAGAGEDSVAAVQALLAADTALTPVIAAAPGVSAKGKLMALASASPLARAAICYAPDAKSLVPVAVAAAARLGLKLGPAEAAQLIALVAADRALLAAELEKLALYRDAAPERQRQVTSDDLVALAATSHDEDVGRVVNAAFGGNAAELAAGLAALEALKVAEIRVLRVMMGRALLLLSLCPAVAAGQPPAMAVAGARPPVFFNEKAAVADQLARWSAPALVRAVARLNDGERAIKAPGSAGRVAFHQLLLDICRVAARRRR